MTESKANRHYCCSRASHQTLCQRNPKARFHTSTARRIATHGSNPQPDSAGSGTELIPAPAGTGTPQQLPKMAPCRGNSDTGKITTPDRLAESQSRMVAFWSIPTGIGIDGGRPGFECRRTSLAGNLAAIGQKPTAHSKTVTRPTAQAPHLNPAALGSVTLRYAVTLRGVTVTLREVAGSRPP